MDKTNADFETALEAFRNTAETVIREHFDRMGFTFGVPHVEIRSRDKRYVKLVRFDVHTSTGEIPQPCALSFVEIDTGDIFKPATFKSPAEHPRGNIYTEDNGRSSMTATGDIFYLS